MPKPALKYIRRSACGLFWAGPRRVLCVSERKKEMCSGTRILLGIVFRSQSENNETVSDKMSHATGRSRWIFAVSELCAAASPWAKLGVRCPRPWLSAEASRGVMDKDYYEAVVEN